MSPTPKSAVNAPPATLSKPTADLWRTVQLDYGITDSAGLALLSNACSCLDRAEQAARAIAVEGLVLANGRPNPCVAIERDARAAFVRSLRALNLDVAPTHEKAGRPPTLHGWTGR